MRFVALALLVACHGTPSASSYPPPGPSRPLVVQAAMAEPIGREPAWLGIRFNPGTTRVLQVIDGSPAAAAGVQAGDEIVSLDGIAMHSPQEIVKAIAAAEPGRRVTVALTREGAPQTFAIELGTRPADDKLIGATLLDNPAPAFTATALDGKTKITPAELRGNVVLLEFWGTWCGPCTTQYPHLARWHRDYASRGLRVLALTDEDRDIVRTYVARQKLTYPVALDPEDRIRADFLVSALPTTVFVDRAGVVRYVSVGVGDPAETERAIERLLR
jgi:peroxiredoxin